MVPVHLNGTHVHVLHALIEGLQNYTNTLAVNY
jgi:hypothetical protein